MKGHFIALGIGINQFIMEYFFIQPKEVPVKYEQTCSRKKGRGFIK